MQVDHHSAVNANTEPDTPLSKPSLQPTFKPSFRVVAFEIEVEGHHPGYVLNFAKAWADNNIPATLDIVVTPDFYQRHADAVQAVRDISSNRVNIQSITSEEYQTIQKFRPLRYFRAWRLFCDYLERLNANHGLVMYFDYFQLPTIMGITCPRPYSAIYFRPTFHYPHLDGYRETLAEKFRNFRKKQLLTQVLKNTELKQLYCLDEIAVDYMQQHMSRDTVYSHIADSFTTYDASIERQNELGKGLGIEQSRTLFLLLGVLDQRKGVVELLQSLFLVSPQAGSQVCIVLAGRIADVQREKVLSLVHRVTHETNIQLILHDEYIPDDQVQHYYDLCDVILATYQKHMGSSSALIRAALAQKPVLSSDYGLMGELVRKKQLGVTVDTGNLIDIATGLTTFINEPATTKFDPHLATTYAEENSPDQLAQDLRKMIHLSLPPPRA